MKKLFSFLLSILLILSIVGCGRVSAPSDEPFDTTEGITAINTALTDEAMSPVQLVSYLSLLNYTDEQINILIEAAEINWGENAKKEVLYRIDRHPYSRLELIDLLQDLGYASEDAIYGVDNSEVDWNEQCKYDYQLFIAKGLTESEAVEQLIAKKYLLSEIEYAKQEENN